MDHWFIGSLRPRRSAISGVRFWAIRGSILVIVGGSIVVIVVFDSGHRGGFDCGHRSYLQGDLIIEFLSLKKIYHTHHRRQKGVADDVFFSFALRKGKGMMQDKDVSTIRAAKKVSKATKTRRPRRLPKLKAEDLSNDAKVLELFSATKTTPVSVFDVELLNVFAAAECALDHGENPPALFSWIVNGRRWHMLTGDQDDRAQQRLRRLRNPEREAERSRRQNEYEANCKRPEPCSLGDVLHGVLEKLFGVSGVSHLASGNRDR